MKYSLASTLDIKQKNNSKKISSIDKKEQPTVD